VRERGPIKGAAEMVSRDSPILMPNSEKKVADALTTLAAGFLKP
jgi:hypothetical protein